MQIDLDESSYGATSSAVIVIRAPTRRALTRLVRDRNFRYAGDNPGQAYAWSCKLLRAIKSDSGDWQGICISSTHFDI